MVETGPITDLKFGPTVRCEGSGATVLVLHGESGADWTPGLAELARQFEVVLPEHPGYGPRPAPDWLSNIHDLAYYYLDYLDENDFTNVHLIGLSLGGWLAAEMAVRNTSRLASLTMVNSAGIHIAGVRQVDPYIKSDEQQIRDLFFDQSVAEELLAQTPRPDADNIRLNNQRTTALLCWQPRNHDPHLRKWLHRIGIPTLLLWGDNNRLFPPAYAKEFQRLIPGSEAVIIPECGHVPDVEKPGVFRGAVADFIGRVGAKR